MLVTLYPEKGLKVIKQLNKDNNNYLKSPLKRNSPNISKISELNWSPLVSIKDGFERTIESYK